jgi:RES domain-containing protein
LALDVDELRVRGTWFKHTRPGRGPLPYRNPAPDNRWQRGSIVDALYLAETPETVWAEWYRHLAEAGVPPAARLPVELWEWKVDLRVADVSDERRLARVGLRLPTPGRRGWPQFQAVGEELWKEGWTGLVAPSAARPDGRVLCVFRTEQDIKGVTPQPPPQTLDDAPVPPTGMTT